MTLRSLLVSLAAAALLLPACAAIAAAPAKTAGGILVNAAGMTLYAFDRDSAGKSACNGACASIWPPLAPGASDAAGGDWSIVKRDDGSKQWAYKGKPVYLWAGDKKPGDKTGDGYNGVWHVVKP
jgi:predicted lipoprotein with Yx(FWY)xxD motif